MTRLLLFTVFLSFLLLPFFSFSLLALIVSVFFGLNFLFLQAVSFIFYLSIMYALAAIIVFWELLLRSPKRYVLSNNLSGKNIVVGMTAYNDEGVVGFAVKDFLSQKGVLEVIVVDNNCRDNTVPEARAAGARIVKEPVQGYGAACMRALASALESARKKNALVLLVEGDQTYVGEDVKKFLAYIGNADMVVGTRTVRELTEPESQVTTLMQYGNVFIAKLLQLKYWDSLRLSDVGCTMRMIRPEALQKVLPLLKVTGNSFSPHMIDAVLRQGYKVVEVPVHFKKRGGISKGIGSDFWKGFPTGLEMIWNILTE